MQDSKTDSFSAAGIYRKNEKTYDAESRLEEAENMLLAHSEEIRELQHVYNSAIRLLQMRFEILNEEFNLKYERNPIHHIEGRLKSVKSIAGKLLRKGAELSVASAKRNNNDIAGVRVVCCYIDDVYAVSDMFLQQKDVTLISRQDYIKEPNYNGYRSLHLDVSVPIFMSDHTENVISEVQLRTVAMDVWASLEHDLRYKKNREIPDEISAEMLAEAEKIADIDRKMEEIHRKVLAL